MTEHVFPDDYRATVEPVRLPSALVQSQATAIEQSRAVAEVQAAIVVAQQCPRDVTAAIAAMRQTTDQQALADRAFFAYKRAGSTIAGPSIHLARELGRVWGNLQYGISELRRDDDAGISEMLAFAWDLQTNTRSASIFIVPHVRDTKDGPKQLRELRDVYENNANQGARRVREAIFAVLPAWFVEEAKTRCQATLERGELAPKIEKAVEVYGGIGIAVEQLVEKIGRPTADWSANDVARLRVMYQSIARGELIKEEEFPPLQRRVTVDEIEQQAEQATQERRESGTPTPDERPAEAAPTVSAPPAEHDAPAEPPASEAGERAPSPQPVSDPAPDPGTGAASPASPAPVPAPTVEDQQAEIRQLNDERRRLKADETPDADVDTEPKKISPGLRAAINGEFVRLGVDDQPMRLTYAATLAGRGAIRTPSDLTFKQATAVMAALQACKTRDELEQRVNGQQSLT